MIEHNLYNLAELRKHDLISDCADQSINGVHSESDCLQVRIFFHVFIESFLWHWPLIGYLVVYVDHVEKDHLK